MKILARVLFLVIFFSLVFVDPRTALAQTPATTLESCFDYYNYGKIRANLATEKTSYRPGETAKIIGTIVNNNTFPLADIVLYAQLKRVNDTGDFIQNGHFLVDRLTFEKGLNFLPGETKWIKASLAIAANYPAGNYEIQYFIFSPNGFHYGGRPFLEEDTAGYSSFSIGSDMPLIYFDPKTLTVNGAPHSIREPIVEFSEPTLSFSVQVVDSRTSPADIPVTIKWYSFEDTFENLLVSSESKTISGSNHELVTSFTPPYPGAFVMVIEMSSPVKSVLKYRFAKSGSPAHELRMNDLGVSNFPATKNDKAWVCFHSPAFADTPETEVTLSLLDASKQMVETKTLQQVFDGEIRAISLPLTKLVDGKDFWIKAVFREPGNANPVRAVETHFDCKRYAQSLKEIAIGQAAADARELTLTGKSICGQAIESGHLDELHLTQDGQIRKEMYNLPLPNTISLDNLPAGSYHLQAKSGVLVQGMSLTVPTQSTPANSLKQLVVIALIFLTIVTGGTIVWKRKKAQGSSQNRS